MDYQSLVRKLNEWAYQYYVLDEPTVSDKEYDALYDELVRVERETGYVAPDSPTRKVGGEPIKAFGTHTHLARLYSLDKAQSADEVRAWYTRITGMLGYAPAVTLEPKLDGLTLCLTYRGGAFVRATTRGNGIVGEDVTAQVLTIKSLPLTISDTAEIEVQGEGVMRLSKFEAYNRTAAEPLKNARNGVAGAIRNLDPRVTAERNLDIYFYNVNYTSGRRSDTQCGMIEWLRAQKFLTAPCTRYTDIDALVETIETYDRARHDYLIDGMVVKVDDATVRADLGYTDKFPRWAVAYKFAAEETSTVLESVEWNVGRTGKVTPLAHLAPVELCGAQIARATLNNMTDIRRKNVAVGDRVFLRRSNDVIPEITGLAERGEGSVPIAPPEVCPGCGSALREVGAHLYCINPDCPPQIVATIEYYCGKDCMDVAGISTATATLMHVRLGVESPADLYTLTREQLLTLDGVKEKKADNVLAAIEKSRDVTLAKFIMALGIPAVGKRTAADLAARYGTLDAFVGADTESLLAVDEVGETIAENIREYVETHGAYIARLASVLRIRAEETGRLTGKKFVLTGTLPALKRSQASALIEEQGGLVASSVAKDTDYVVVGEDAGSKLAKAEKLGISLLDEKGLLQLLQKN